MRCWHRKKAVVFSRLIGFMSKTVMTGIVFLVLFSGISYSSFHTRVFDFPDVVLALCGMGLLMFLWISAGKMPAQRQWIWIASAGLFFLQLVMIKSLLFCTGWDAGTVWNDAYQAVFGESSGQAVNWAYFDTYPNNRLLLVVLILTLRVCRLVGVSSPHVLYFLLVVFQCMLLVLTGLILFDMILRHTGQVRRAWFGWIVYAGWIGLSPWLLIVYSDTLGILFPMAILWIYFHLFHSKYWIRWLAVGFVSAIGYRMKATCSIVLIALFLSEFVLCPMLVMCEDSDRRRRRSGILHKVWETIFSLLLVAVCFLGAGTAVDGAYSHLTKTTVNKEGSIGFAHYFKMGLNQGSTGTFNYDDVDASLYAPDSSTRNRENMEEAFRRIRAMGGFQTGVLYCRKTRMNYNDGSFGYGLGGKSFIETDYVGKPQGAVETLLREFFRPDGKNFHWYLDIAQAVWLALLVLVTAGLWNGDNKNCVFNLILLGIWMFTTLFEGQQRYLFLYGPVFILVAASSRWIPGRFDSTEREKF